MAHGVAERFLFLFGPSKSLLDWLIHPMLNWIEVGGDGVPALLFFHDEWRDTALGVVRPWSTPGAPIYRCWAWLGLW